VSALRQAAEEYLIIRRALGFKLESQEPLLVDFVGYLDEAGAARLTIELALAWATRPAGREPIWWSQRLCIVRGFAKHLHALDPDSAVPPADLLPAGKCRATPYLYARDDVLGLMTAARALPVPLQAATYETLIGLLAVTGLRIGEAIRLDRNTVDLDHDLLTVIHSKFGKSREIPLHRSTAGALRDYARRRDELCRCATTPSFFLSTTGTRLLPSCVRRVFGRLVRTAGLPRRSGRCRPRLHDLRHSFAVGTVLNWYRDGADVEANMPRLSTYLGHVDPASTYWYLEAAPELLALAGERLERALGELP
jgi:integrase/recombinase XerD